MTGRAFGHGYLQAQRQIPGLAKPVKLFLETACPETAAAAASTEDVADMDIRAIIEIIQCASGEGL